MEELTLPHIIPITTGTDTFLLLCPLNTEVLHMDLSELPSELINRIESFKSDSRKAEVITTHFLLEKATGSKHIVHYDAFNKPYLKGNPLSLSISHSSHYAAVFLSVTSCGVDVETISSRASKIAHKFVHDSERLLISGYTENQADTIIWSVKEAVYKISGQPDFKSSILIRSDIRPDKEMLHVDIINRNNTQKIKVFYRIFEDQVIAWTHEDISI